VRRSKPPRKAYVHLVDVTPLNVPRFPDALQDSHHRLNRSFPTAGETPQAGSDVAGARPRWGCPTQPRAAPASHLAAPHWRIVCVLSRPMVGPFDSTSPELRVKCTFRTSRVRRPWGHITMARVQGCRQGEKVPKNAHSDPHSRPRRPRGWTAMPRPRRRRGPPWAVLVSAAVPRGVDRNPRLGRRPAREQRLRRPPSRRRRAWPSRLPTSGPAPPHTRVALIPTRRISTRLAAWKCLTKCATPRHEQTSRYR
jgi:hypothetical protein